MSSSRRPQMRIVALFLRNVISACTHWGPPTVRVSQVTPPTVGDRGVARFRYRTRGAVLTTLYPSSTRLWQRDGEFMLDLFRTSSAQLTVVGLLGSATVSLPIAPQRIGPPRRDVARQAAVRVPELVARTPPVRLDHLSEALAIGKSRTGAWRQLSGGIAGRVSSRMRERLSRSTQELRLRWSNP